MLQRKYALMRDLDKSLQESQRPNEQRCEQEIKVIEWGVKSGIITPDTSFIRFSGDALDAQKHCIRIAEEMLARTIQAYDLVGEHIKKLDQYLRKFDEELRREGDLAAASAVSPQNPDSDVKSGKASESIAGRRKKTRFAVAEATVDAPSMEMDLPVDPNEATYCLCNQVSYGEMVACDNPDCKIEWFHYGCVGVREQHRGKWYCTDCVGSQKRRKGK